MTESVSGETLETIGIIFDNFQKLLMTGYTYTTRDEFLDEIYDEKEGALSSFKIIDDEIVSEGDSLIFRNRKLIGKPDHKPGKQQENKKNDKGKGKKGKQGKGCVPMTQFYIGGYETEYGVYRNFKDVVYKLLGINHYSGKESTPFLFYHVYNITTSEFKRKDFLTGESTSGTKITSDISILTNTFKRGHLSLSLIIDGGILRTEISNISKISEYKCDETDYSKIFNVFGEYHTTELLGKMNEMWFYQLKNDSAGIQSSFLEIVEIFLKIYTSGLGQIIGGIRNEKNKPHNPHVKAEMDVILRNLTAIDAAQRSVKVVKKNKFHFNLFENPDWQ